MNKILQKHIDFLNSRNISYYTSKEYPNTILFKESLDSHPNVSYVILIYFNSDTSNVCSISIGNLLKVRHITFTLLEKINKLNEMFDGYKITVTNNGEIRIRIDSLLDGDTDKILAYYIVQLADMVDDVYQELMRVI